MRRLIQSRQRPLFLLPKPQSIILLDKVCKFREDRSDPINSSLKIISSLLKAKETRIGRTTKRLLELFQYVRGTLQIRLDVFDLSRTILELSKEAMRLNGELLTEDDKAGYCACCGDTVHFFSVLQDCAFAMSEVRSSCRHVGAVRPRLDLQEANFTLRCSTAEILGEALRVVYGGW